MRWALSAPLLLVVAGCAVIHRPPATVASLTAEEPAILGVERATVDSIVDRLARRAIRRGDRRLDILLLSGGGENGAYGAGFLRGWRTRTTDPMPSFDLVTGISTGAVQAPFAFLGTQTALDSLGSLYRHATDLAPTFDAFFWLRKTGGVVKTGRYQETIREVIDQRMSVDLERGFDEGRQLAIGTTDFDLAIRRTWNVGDELVQSGGGLPRIHSLILATTAIPGVFPPVIIDGHVNVDGGVISNVLPVLGLQEYRRLADRIRAGGVTEPVTVRMWVIMNLWLDQVPFVTNPADRGMMTSRTELLLFVAQHRQILSRLIDLSRAVSADVPGLRMEIRATAIPSAMATEPGANDLFNRAWMTRLEQFAFERARGASLWDVVVPAPPSGDRP